MARKKKKKQPQVSISSSVIRRIRKDAKAVAKTKQQNAKRRAREAKQRERDIKKGEALLSQTVKNMSKIAPKSTGRKSSVKLSELPMDYTNYTPQSIRAVYGNNEKLMRQEYTRLRSAATKRLKRLAKSEFAGSEVFKFYNNQLARLRDIPSDKIPEALVSVNRFLNNPLSTIRGQVHLRNERILTLREYGYNVTIQNFEKVTEVMEQIRVLIRDKMYDSDQAIQDTIDIINSLLSDPNTDWENESKYKIAEDVFKRYASSSSELLELSER